ncbi:MAG: ATP-binding protein [Oligoflexales bacterium]
MSLGHTIWMAIIFIVLGVVLYRSVEDNIQQSLDASLLTSARSIRDAQFSRKRSLAQILMDELYDTNRFAIHAQMIDMSGHVTAKTGNMQINLPVTPRAVSRAENGLETFETFQLSNGDLRLVTIPVYRQGRFKGQLIQVGTPMGPTYDTLKKLKATLLLSLSSCFIISIVFGYLLTKGSFKPVARITQAARNLNVHDLNVRLKLPPANDELRELTATLNGMLDRLEDAFQRLRQFAGNVSHELRTPLAVLRGEVELALRRERTTEEYKTAMRTIAKEAGNMSTIVEDLLLLAKAQGNAIELKRQDVYIPEFVAGLKNDLQKLYNHKGVELEVENISADYFPLSPVYFSLAIKNLLINACNHSKAGQPVKLTTIQTKDSLQFKIQDKGDGISEDALPYIFDAFYRADTARNRAIGGAGIGLSLSLALVRLHGGDIKVSSVVNQGSEFTIVLPTGSQKSQVPGLNAGKSEKVTVVKKAIVNA